MTGIVESTGYEIKISIPTTHNQLGRVITPGLIGLSAANADSAISSAGLVKGDVTLTTGNVTRQTPHQGGWSLDGDTMTYTLTS